MGFVPESFFLAVCWSGLVTLVSFFFRRKHTITGRGEIYALLAVCGFGLLRLLAPVDFPPSRGVFMPADGIFSTVYFFFVDRRSLGALRLSLWELFLIVWAAGALWKLFRFLREYRRVLGRVSHLEPYFPEKTAGILCQIAERTGKKGRFDVLCMPGLCALAGIGLFHRRILMPDSVCTDEELYYILLHETTHFANGDLFLKFGLQIVRCLLWWNPCTAYLQRELSQALELRCDLAVIRGGSAGSVRAYMNVLLSQVRHAREGTGGDDDFLTGAASSMAQNTGAGALKERFTVIAGEYGEKRKRNYLYPVLAILAAALFLGSYTFLISPSSNPPIEEIEEDGAIAYGPENAVVVFKDQVYYLVIDGLEPMVIDESEANMYVLEDGFRLESEF